MRPTIVKELYFSELSRNERYKHSEIDDQHMFILLIDGIFHSGQFSTYLGKFTFRSRTMTTTQFDPPYENGCRTQKVWKVIDANGLTNPEAILLMAGLDPVSIARDDEENYAYLRREFAILYGMTYNGVRITDESPISAWMYKSNEPKMPYVEEEDEEEY